jgi:hypothetical protein
MGKSDSLLKDVYQHIVLPINEHFNHPISVAVLGSPQAYFVSDMFTDASFDYFDIRLNNWNINSDWQLGKQYDVILCTRCPYFAKDPQTFVEKCYQHLNADGVVLLDWGYGDHWRFPNYKIGWLKNGEHEYCYGETNYLWSGIWDDSFLNDSQFQLFARWVKKWGYEDIKKAIMEEVPKILPLTFVNEYFETKVKLLALWEKSPQLYIFVTGSKRLIIQ